MSEEPEAGQTPEETPAQQAEPTPEAEGAEAPAPAPAPEGLLSLRALVVGVAAFVVVILIVITIFLFTPPSGDAPPEEAPEAGEDADEPPAEGGFVNVLLLDGYQFTTTLPPRGDRSVTYDYSITVKVIKSRREKLDALMDPEKENMMSTVRESIRKIIGREDYLRLRAEQLDDVKRHIKIKLNALMNSEVVEDVIFDKWNVH